MQTVELKDQHGNVMMYASSQNSGTFKTPTFDDAKNYFMDKIRKNEHLWINEPIDDKLVCKLKILCEQWFNFYVEDFVINNNCELVELVIHQSRKLEISL